MTWEQMDSCKKLIGAGFIPCQDCRPCKPGPLPEWLTPAGERVSFSEAVRRMKASAP